MTEHELYAATVHQVVRLERRLAEVARELTLLQVEAATRALAAVEAASDAAISNSERAAWARLERRLGGLRALADVVRAPAAGRRPAAEQAVAEERAALQTASGPGGEGGDVPSGPADPLLEPVTIAIPAGLPDAMTAVRWWIEEEQRATEMYLFDRADDIRRKLIQPFGLLYALESKIKSLTELVTGKTP
jgi:hypothetical protein